LIKKDYEAGGIKRTRAEELLKINKPEIKDKDLFKTLDEIDYEKETGEDIENYSVYIPIKDAIDKGDSKEFESRKEHLIKNGYKESDINSQVKSYIKEMYEDGEVNRKEAENLMKKYLPGMKEQEITVTLDGVDYEKKTCESKSNYSMYTPLKDALAKDSEKDVQEAKSYLKKNGYEEKDINSEIKSTITGQYRDGTINRSTAESRLKKYAKDMTANDIWFTLDRVDYKKETGKDAGSGYSYRLKDAMDSNKSAEITKAVKELMKHGRTQKQILDVTGDYKSKYLKANSAEKVKIRNAIQMVYKAAGSTAAEADKKISKWK
jgi:hypothetical protein